MTGIYIEEISPLPRRIQPAAERVAIVGRSRGAPLPDPVAVAGPADFEAVFGTRRSPLRRAVTAYLDQGGDAPLVIGAVDLQAALASLAGTGVSLLVVAPGMLRGHEAEVHAWCLEHQCFLMADSPDGSLPAGLGANAAVYAPRLRDPGGRRVWSSAAVAGVTRRLDLARGVWTAPAGPDADVRGLAADPVPPAGVANVIRAAPDGRTLVWDAHTASDDPEWKYVNIRRLVLWLERSIDEGTQWAVFEPNDEPLWTAVSQEIQAFMVSLWEQGALVGRSVEDAFFVRCDRTTMTQNDLDNGRLICLVGIAAIRPAEFVIVRICRTVGTAG